MMVCMSLILFSLFSIITVTGITLRNSIAEEKIVYFLSYLRTYTPPQINANRDRIYNRNT